MKNNTNAKEAESNMLVKLPPLPADAEYRKEHQKEAAFADPTDEQNIENNENKETPANVSGAEPIPNSASVVSDESEKDTYNRSYILETCRK